jgi:hypothetical protein
MLRTMTSLIQRVLHVGSLRCADFLWFAAATAMVFFVLGLVSTDATAAFGLKVMKQEWDSKTPTRNTLITLTDSQTALSDALQRSWNAARVSICADISRHLGAPGAIGGQTMRNIVCVAGPAGNLTGSQSSATQAQFRFRVSGNRLDFDIDVPAAGSQRFRFAFDAVFDIQASLHGYDPVVRVERTDTSVENVTADPPYGSIATLVVPYIAPQLQFDFSQAFNSALTDTNSAIKTTSGGAQGWIRQQKLILALLPVNAHVAISGAGTIAGVIRGVPSIGSGAASCSGFSVLALIQTGPPPIENPDGPNFGPAPTSAVGKLGPWNPARKVGNQWECSYNLVGLPSGIPVTMQIRSSDPGIVAVTPTNWNGVTVATANGKDFQVQASIGTVLAGTGDSGGTGIAGAAPTPVASQAGAYGLKVLRQDWDPRNPSQEMIQVVMDSATALSDSADRQWSASRSALCRQIEDALGGVGAVGGATLRDVTCVAGASGELRGVETGTNRGQFSYTVRGNRIGFDAGLPGLGNQRIGMTFDAMFVADAVLHTKDTILHLERTRVDIQNVKTGMPVGALLNAIIPIVAGYLRYDLSSAFTPVLGALNADLKSSGRPVKGWVRQGKLYVAFLPIANALDSGAGAISGTVHWPDSVLGASQIPCDRFSVQSVARTGPAPIEDPEGPRLGVAPTKRVGTLQLEAASRMNGKRFECSYTLAGLPIGVPLALQARSADSRIVGLVPDGWNGVAAANATGRHFRGSATLSGLFPARPLTSIPAAMSTAPTAPMRALKTTVAQMTQPAKTPPAQTLKAAPPTVKNVDQKLASVAPTASRMEPDTNRFGGDYTNRNLATAQQCQAACASEAQCKAWTWVKPGVQGPSAKCWLKNSAPVASRNDCCVSGVK